MTEIKRAIQLCEASHPELKIKHCLVSGQAELAAGFFLEEKTLQFVKANPIAALFLAPHINMRELQCATTKLMICCGLAMRRIPTW
jgi:Tfp pilus assembly PilM family ATPase